MNADEQRAANAAAAAERVLAGLDPIQRVLNNVVGLTQPQCVAIEADGYQEFMDFENMNWINVEKWIYSARRANLNRGGFSISAAKEKRMQALAFWVNDLLRTGKAKVEADFEEADISAPGRISELAEEAYI